MLEMQEETAVEIKEEYSNLQQEVEMKSKKLKKMYHKLQNIQQEIHDVTEEFNTDRRELEMTQNDLLKWVNFTNFPYFLVIWKDLVVLTLKKGPFTKASWCFSDETLFFTHLLIQLWSN